MCRASLPQEGGPRCTRWLYRQAILPAHPAYLVGHAVDLATAQPPSTTTARSKPMPPLAQHGLRQLRAPGSDSGRRPAVMDTVRATTPTPAVLALRLLAASARLTNSPGSDTADAGTPGWRTPDAQMPGRQLDTGHRTPGRPYRTADTRTSGRLHRTLDTGRVDIAGVDTGRSHRTPDAAEDRTG
jgi:hypothetical protein